MARTIKNTTNVSGNNLVLVHIWWTRFIPQIFELMRAPFYSQNEDLRGKDSAPAKNGASGILSLGISQWVRMVHPTHDFSLSENIKTNLYSEDSGVAHIFRRLPLKTFVRWKINERGVFAPHMRILPLVGDTAPHLVSRPAWAASDGVSASAGILSCRSRLPWVSPPLQPDDMSDFTVYRFEHWPHAIVALAFLWIRLFSCATNLLKSAKSIVKSTSKFIYFSVFMN